MNKGENNQFNWCKLILDIFLSITYGCVVLYAVIGMGLLYELTEENHSNLPNLFVLLLGVAVGVFFFAVCYAGPDFYDRYRVRDKFHNNGEDDENKQCPTNELHNN